MANALKKNTRITVIPGVDGTPPTPYVPAQPARTVYEYRRVCGFVPVRTTDGRYIFSTDLATGESDATWVPNTLGSSGGALGSWQCWMQTIPVTYPATPARAATPGVLERPAQVLQNFNMGWNAGARSKDIFTGDGAVQFQARASMVGAIVGMNLANDAPGGLYRGRNIDFAFYLSHGVARIMEGGVDKGFAGLYIDATVFKVQRTSGEVEYLMDEVVVYTSLIDDTDAPGWLEASLYSGGDEVFNPQVLQVSEPDLTAGTGDGEVVLPPLAILAADRPMGQAEVVLPVPEIEAGYEIAIPRYGVATVVLPLLSAFGTMLTGEIGSGEVTLPRLEMLGADHAYGEGTVVLPSLLLAGTAEEQDRINMRIEVVLDFAIDTTAMDTLDVSPRMVLSVDLAIEQVQQIDLRDTVILDVPLSLGVVETIDASDIVILDVSMSLPGTGLEVHAVNTDGFGSTSYRDFAFTSMARIGDRYYGTNERGLFELSGDSDDGAPIQAALCPGTLDFDSSQNKTISEVWLGVRSDAPLACKLEVEGREFVYLAESHSCDVLAQHRIKFGKGLKANYITPVFYNLNGEDFEIDALEFAVATLSRKG